MRKFTVGLCQALTTPHKIETLSRHWDMLCEAKAGGAEVCVLGEMFACPFRIKAMQANVEELRWSALTDFSQVCASAQPTVDLLRFASAELQLLIIGGSFPRADSGRLFNTCAIFDRGELLAVHEKAHLFDVNIPGRFAFQESRVFTPGDRITCFETRFGRFGVGICYDVRFALYAMALRKMGAEVIFYPSYFGMETGPKAFLGLGMARALDTQCCVALGSSARPGEAFGHSCLFDARGAMAGALDSAPGLLLREVDLADVDAARASQPYTSAQMRDDLYAITYR